jgi:hypothetical protein
VNADLFVTAFQEVQEHLPAILSARGASDGDLAAALRALDALASVVTAVVTAVRAASAWASSAWAASAWDGGSQSNSSRWRRIGAISPISPRASRPSRRRSRRPGNRPVHRSAPSRPAAAWLHYSPPVPPGRASRRAGSGPGSSTVSSLTRRGRFHPV